MRCVAVPVILTLTVGLGGTRADDVIPAAPASRPWPTLLRDRYEAAADRIIKEAVGHPGAYNKLERLCDDVGHRLSGSKALDDAIALAVRTMKADGHDNVHTEPVMVPRWVRGQESATLIGPRREQLSILGLGGSIGTPPEGITAEVVVVDSEDQLKALGDGATGKIVLFNNVMPSYDPEKGSGYGTAVRFRGKGAQLVAAQGGVACLVRSVTAKSLRSPHTGAMRYGDAATKIPAAAISTEDAALIARLTARGIKVVVNLKMEARSEGEVPSANVVGELRGREKPDEVVVISGHLDSWDVGQGAHDDGAGCVMAMEAISVLRRLDLIPRRTIRVVLWTNEENGLAGGRQYAKDHAEELPKHVAAIEADSGGFRPTGFSFEVADPLEGKPREKLIAEQLADIAALLAPLGANKAKLGGSGADISAMKPAGVPLLGLEVEGSTYFDYHHTAADTFDKIDPIELSQSTAAMAVMAFVLADMPTKLGDAPEAGNSR